MHGKLATKVKTIDITRFALKTQYNSNKSGRQKEIDNTGNKIPDTSGLVKKKKQIIMLSSLIWKARYQVLRIQ